MSSWSFFLTIAIMLLLRAAFTPFGGIREKYQPEMPVSDLGKLGVRIGAPGSLEGSVLLGVPGLMHVQTSSGVGAGPTQASLKPSVVSEKINMTSDSPMSGLSRGGDPAGDTVINCSGSDQEA